MLFIMNSVIKFMWIKKTSVFHPYFFAIFPIISTYSTNMQELLPNYLIQPVVIMLIFTTIIFLITKLIFKNWSKSGIFVSTIIGLIFSYGYIYFQISGFELGGFTIGRHMFLIIPYVVAFFIIGLYIFRTKLKFDNITKILNVVGITLILVSVTNIGIYALENEGLGIVVLEQESINETVGIPMNIQDKKMISLVGDLQKYPDVYYIILDGYAGESSLERDLGFNNSKFIELLEQKGFFIASNSHSNYAQTFLSIPSTMNMKYLNFLKDVLGEESKDQITPMMMMENSLVMEIFKSKGYKTIDFPNNSFEKINSDYKACENENFLESNKLMTMINKINMFEYFLTIIKNDNLRKNQECFFTELSEIHDKFEEPVFILGHIVLPHPPNVFGPNGEHVMPRIYYNEWGTQEDKDRYLGTLQYANLRIEEFVNNVLNDNERDSIIIISSDHGTDFDFDWDNPNNEMLKQRFSNFNAYYMPKGQELLYENISPVNSFRIMFNSNFNGNFELLEDKAYWSTYDKPYKFEDVTEIVKNP